MVPSIRMDYDSGHAMVEMMVEMMAILMEVTMVMSLVQAMEMTMVQYWVLPMVWY